MKSGRVSRILFPRRTLPRGFFHLLPVSVTMRNKHIIIAEDDTFLARMMEQILTKEGLHCTVVHNGKRAVEAMEKNIPDLLLLDLLMPVMDGYGVLTAMKKREWNCPVVVLSNLSDKATMEKCKKMGVKDCFVKSDMDDDALRPLIRKYIR